MFYILLDKLVHGHMSSVKIIFSLQISFYANFISKINFRSCLFEQNRAKQWNALMRTRTWTSGNSSLDVVWREIRPGNIQHVLDLHLMRWARVARAWGDRQLTWNPWSCLWLERLCHPVRQTILWAGMGPNPWYTRPEGDSSSWTQVWLLKNRTPSSDRSTCSPG